MAPCPTPSFRTSAPTRSPSAAPASPATRTRSTASATTRASPSTRRDAVERFGTTIAAVMAQAQQNSTVGYRAEELQSITVQGVTEDYLEFSTFDAERGRMMSPVEVQRNRPVALVGWQVADRLFGPEDPLDKFIKVAGVPFRIVGVSAKKGAFFGNSLDEFVVIPLGRYQKLFGSRQSLALMVKPRETDPGGGRQGRGAHRPARRPPSRPRRARRLRHRRLRFGARHLPAGHRRHRHRAGRHRRAVAARRRHRHHEHHADGGQRADPRDRPAQGAGRQGPRHHVAGADRVDHAVGDRAASSASPWARSSPGSSPRSPRCRRRSKPGRWRSASW